MYFLLLDCEILRSQWHLLSVARAWSLSTPLIHQNSRIFSHLSFYWAASNWSAVVIIQNYDSGAITKWSSDHPNRGCFKAINLENALTGWHVAHETLIKVYSEHLLPAFWNSHFRKGTERNHLIGMRALYIIHTNDSVRCHRQHKVDLMPTAREISPKTGCMLPIISRQKRQTIRVWKKYDGLQWRVWKESQGRER